MDSPSNLLLVPSIPDPDNDLATPNYEARFDLGQDGDIDIVDVMRLTAHWGKDLLSGDATRNQ